MLKTINFRYFRGKKCKKEGKNPKKTKKINVEGEVCKMKKTLNRGGNEETTPNQREKSNHK